MSLPADSVHPPRGINIQGRRRMRAFSVDDEETGMDLERSMTDPEGPFTGYTDTDTDSEPGADAVLLHMKPKPKGRSRRSPPEAPRVVRTAQKPLQAAAQLRGRKKGGRYTTLKAPFSDVEDVDHPPTLRIGAYCVAQQMDLPLVVKHFKKTQYEHKVLNEEVLRITMRAWDSTADAYVFATYGSIVFWNLPVHLEEICLRQLEAANVFEGSDEQESDEFYYYYSSMHAAGSNFYVEGGTIVLPEVDDVMLDRQHRLALSYALATSVKLRTFEVAIEKTIESTAHIPEEMAENGRISMSRKDVTKFIGQLYMQKSWVNLMFDMLDAPDFFWDLEDLEKWYSKARKMLDIDQRVDVLNKRLDVLAELLEILRTEKSETHSERLEWVVIWLIVVEVLIGIWDIGFGIYTHNRQNDT